MCMRMSIWGVNAPWSDPRLIAFPRALSSPSLGLSTECSRQIPFTIAWTRRKRGFSRDPAAINHRPTHGHLRVTTIRSVEFVLIFRANRSDGRPVGTYRIILNEGGSRLHLWAWDGLVLAVHKTVAWRSTCGARRSKRHCSFVQRMAQRLTSIPKAHSMATLLALSLVVVKVRHSRSTSGSDQRIVQRKR